MPRSRTTSINVGDPVRISIQHTGNIAFNAIEIIKQAMAGLSTTDRRNVQNWIERETHQIEREQDRARRNENGGLATGSTRAIEGPAYYDEEVPF